LNLLKDYKRNIWFNLNENYKSRTIKLYNLVENKG